MSTMGNKKDDLLFIFIGPRGLQIGSIFFQLIKEDYKGKRYDILEFFSKVFYICETEKEFREIGTLIEGYVPEENVLLMGELETTGDLWSNIEENDDILANRVFAPLMFAVDQLNNPKILLFYNLSNGKQSGICDYLLNNFPLVKKDMPIYVVATTSIDEGAGALSIYWSILGLNSIIEGATTKACILLDYEAIGNSIYLHRIKKFTEFDFESYNYVVAYLIYALTHYDREPYANAVPFCQMIDKLTLFEGMKFIIPFMTMPRRELIEDEKFSGYLNELVNDCNLFSIRYKDKEVDGEIEEVPKMSLANAFIAFGEKQDTEYLNLIRQNLPPIMEYLPGAKSFYTYPRGEPFSIFVENNTVVRQYFQDLLEKFDILMSHHSYLHVLEDLGITEDSFGSALDKLVSLVDAYQECEDLLYDEEDFDYEQEIEKYTELEDEEALDEKYGDQGEKEISTDDHLLAEEGTEKLEKPLSIPKEGENVEKEKEIEKSSEEKGHKQPKKQAITLTNSSSSVKQENIKPKLAKATEAPTDTKGETFSASSITKMNEKTIKTKEPRYRPRRRKRTKTGKEIQKSFVMRGSQSSTTNVESEEEAGALKWLEMRASKEKEKVKQEKDELIKQKEEIEKKKKEFEEAQEQIRLEEERQRQEEQRQTEEKKEELKKLAKMFDNL